MNKVTNYMLFLSTETIKKNLTAFLWVLLSILIMLFVMNREITIINWIITGIPFDATNYLKLLQNISSIVLSSNSGNLIKLQSTVKQGEWLLKI